MRELSPTQVKPRRATAQLGESQPWRLAIVSSYPVYPLDWTSCFLSWPKNSFRWRIRSYPDFPTDSRSSVLWNCSWSCLNFRQLSPAVSSQVQPEVAKASSVLTAEKKIKVLICSNLHQDIMGVCQLSFKLSDVYNAEFMGEFAHKGTNFQHG